MSDKFEPNNPIAAAQRQRFSKHVSSLKLDFEKLNDAVVRTIPEIVFKKHFLPLFTGEDLENWKEKLNYWIQIAGNQRAAVNVVDAKNKFIVRVPPLYGDDFLAPISARREDVKYAMHVSQTKGQISPTLAHSHIANELTHRLLNMQQRGNPQKDIDSWLILFKHYGKLPKNAVLSGTAAAQDVDDEFEF